MIKFFRRIRQRLLAENRFSKYLLYAIGEIILVVIGILIALQINTWNEYKQNRKLERTFYADLLEDLANDIRKFEEQTAFYENRVEQLGWLLQKVRDPQAPIDADAFGQRVEPLYYSNEAISYAATYNASESSGVFSTFTNKELLKKITQYYANFHLLMEVTASTNEIIVSQFEPLMATIPENYVSVHSSHYVLNQDSESNQRFYAFLDSIPDKRTLEVDFRSLVDRPQFENYVIGDLGRSFNSLSVMAQRKASAEALIRDIKTYLND
ncbi:DUF6090 family protein [Robiginitalea sediminis]|uniref:DUF6090 family protein n=1 Tax=Robiginitalea sediminis TaxID=1982593 RepID=UPI000B4A84FA|nr:DUF6090 family protein [Robiginitalea sediminis]